ncbi:hypothetical protein KRX51_03830 [Corynebacterium sp. TAE3-ERU12]|uniref:hypothetical protein n=1 Tax=Corynebacterium sp. TAE3-ERU12 TaxID=2849491 RepID=UPI001C4931CC|nr:hypothetical protein [Corynebacterium sp. TAE3-ERU12]MBV7295047.1 hypothetical protein [Corynebacterium sp. TAE3-ERU12]
MIESRSNRAVASEEATTTSTAYSVGAVAGLVIIAVFGGLPTVIEGQPKWAAIAGVVGVIVGAVMLGVALNGVLRERRRQASH